MKKIKKLLLILVVFYTSNIINAQCEISAGINRNICSEENIEGPQLYGDVISGDIIQFIWESEYYEPILDQTYYASIMLSDTTILQPTIEQHFEKTVKYFLTGITSANESCVDSVELNFSDWLFLTVNKAAGKSPSDTIELWIAAESNWPHKKYEWSPNYMISDTTVQKPKVWNDTTVFYDLIITDSLGCSVTDDLFEVYVNNTSTNKIVQENLKVFPNPSSDIMVIECDKQINDVKLFDLKGRLIQEINGLQMNLSDLKDGFYFLQIKIKNGETIYRKICKRNKP